MGRTHLGMGTPMIKCWLNTGHIAKLAFLSALALCLINNPAWASDSDIDRRETDTLVMENIPKNAASEGARLGEHMLTTGSYSFIGYDLEGKKPYFTRRGNVYHLRPGSEPKLVLDQSKSLGGSRVARVCGKEGFYFTRDKDGDEYHRVFVARWGKEREQLSVGKAKNVALRLSPEKERLIYASSPENSGVWSLVVQNLCGDTTPRTLMSLSERPIPYDWSPDGTQVVVSLPGKLMLVDIITGKYEVIMEGPNGFNNALFSQSGDTIFFTSNNHADHESLYSINLKSGQVSNIASNLGWDIEDLVMSDDRSRIAILLNFHGFHRVLLLDTVNMKPIPGGPKKSPGVIRRLRFSPDNENLIMALSQPNSSNRVVVHNIEKQKMTIWTGGFSRDQKVVEMTPDLIFYPTFDKHNGEQRKIPALVYMPPDLKPGQQVPVLISAHGGPASQSRPEFSRTVHYYVTKLGIAVIEPNIRGSIGYGREYEALDDGLLREDSIKDIGALIDWIGGDKRFDTNRVAIAGGSYGGYVSMASVIKYGDKLKAGITRVGISDFETFLQNTERNRVNNRRREYGDERDPELKAFFDRISPVKNSDKITTPMLVIQGARDPRVPAGQAEQIRDAARAQNTPVWFLLGKNEGHSFSNRSNVNVSRGAQILFLKKYLLGQD